MTRVILATFFLAFTSNAISQDLSVTHEFKEGQTASAAEVNQNFNDLVIGINTIVRKDDTLFNTATGAFAINPNLTTTGTNNTANGYDALYNNTTGSNNTAVGYQALRANNTGGANTASGVQALLSNIGGNFNTASGYGALFENTEGSANTASGTKALYKNDTGDFNTASGSFSLFNNNEGDNNTASGYSALFSNTTGIQNSAFGALALQNNTANDNTAIGYMALSSNTFGTQNTAIGSQALFSNVSNAYNTAVGHKALYSNTIGRNNVATGAYALYSVKQDGYNVAVGMYAGYDATGMQNTFVGDHAGDNNNSGSQNTFIGNGARLQEDGIFAFNSTAIGHEARINASNKVRIGNAFVTVIEGQVAFTTSSDARLKEDIAAIENGLAFVNDLNPVSYHRINSSSDDIEMGLLAQQVQETLAAHGLSKSGMVHHASEDAYRSVRYNDLLAPMIRAIQELDDAAETKDQQIASLEQRLQSQQEELLVIVQSQQEQMAVQQEQIAKLQRAVEHQFASR